MTKNDLIKEELSTMHVLDVLNKYDNVDDLFIILNLLLEKRDYRNIGTVLAHLPVILQYDETKCFILKKYPGSRLCVLPNR